MTTSLSIAAVLKILLQVISYGGILLQECEPMEQERRGGRRLVRAAESRTLLTPSAEWWTVQSKKVIS
jgi:hypothetical protein